MDSPFLISPAAPYFYDSQFFGKPAVRFQASCHDFLHNAHFVIDLIKNKYAI